MGRGHAGRTVCREGGREPSITESVFRNRSAWEAGRDPCWPLTVVAHRGSRTLLGTSPQATVPELSHHPSKHNTPVMFSGARARALRR